MASLGFETAQTKVWQGDFGREYAHRNTLQAEQLDRLRNVNFGARRSALNLDFLKSPPKDASYLQLVKEQRLSYFENENVDSMFLLRKTP